MSTLRGPRTLAFAFAASLVATACSSGGSSAAPTASPTVRASTTPAASPSATALPLVQEGGAPLGPGTYTTVFQPKITFTTNAAWVPCSDGAGSVRVGEAGGGVASGEHLARRVRVGDPRGIRGEGDLR